MNRLDSEPPVLGWSITCPCDLLLPHGPRESLRENPQADPSVTCAPYGARSRSSDSLLLAPTGPLSDVDPGLIPEWHMLDPVACLNAH